VINGVHAIIFSDDAEGVRAFVREVLGLPSVDAGGGWLIFALPPTELAAHPNHGQGRHELYLMCDDIEDTVQELKAKGVEFTREISDEGVRPHDRAAPSRRQRAGDLRATPPEPAVTRALSLGTPRGGAMRPRSPRTPASLAGPPGEP
jgi:hypothetical protein